MATVYSLVCWGGRTGKTVSISATTDVVTLTGHGLLNGHKLWPSGTLPAELSTDTPVYARSTAVNTFTLHTSEAGAIAGTGNITFAGSSTYAAVVLKSDLIVSPSTRLASYGLSDLSRWGSSGSERIYDGLASWNSGRSGASSIDVEFCELGEAFTDTFSAAMQINVPAAALRIESKINGVRTEAFHAGVIGAGYIAYQGSASATTALHCNRDRTVLNGFTFKVTSGFYGSTGLLLSAFGQSAISLIVIGSTGFASIGTVATGISQSGPGCSILQCVVCGWNHGISITQYMAGLLVANNQVTKCTIGMRPAGTTNLIGAFYANISVGNTTNWGASAGFTTATQNFGLTGEAWIAGSGTRGVIATTDFLDYSGGVFKPASASSPQVDTGVDYYTAPVVDIADAVRPSYENGTTTYYDAGAYEFDHGYGPWPASYTLELTGIPAGSEVRCYTGSKGASAVEIGGTETTTGTSYSFSHSSGGVAGFIHIIHPDYAIQQFDYTYQAADTTIPIQMPADRWYSNPA